jgi:hypothetical protein
MGGLMIKLELTLDECQRLLAIVATAPWSQANPLIMKIGEQMRMQEAAVAAQRARGNGVDADPPTA